MLLLFDESANFQSIREYYINLFIWNDLALNLILVTGTLIWFQNQIETFLLLHTSKLIRN